MNFFKTIAARDLKSGRCKEQMEYADEVKFYLEHPWVEGTKA